MCESICNAHFVSECELCMSTRQGCIYLLRNLVNGKGYVGQYNNAAKVERRWASHIHDARKGYRSLLCNAIRKSWRTYGSLKNFSAEVIWKGPVGQLNAKEIYYVAKLHTFVDDPKGGGYNLTTGGRQASIFSLRTKKALRRARGTPQARKDNSARMMAWLNLPGNREAHIASHSSPEIRAKLSESTYRRYQKEEERRKSSKAAQARYAKVKERVKTANSLSTYFANNPEAVELSRKTALATWAKRRAMGLMYCTVRVK